ncbi:MAG: hypothetical protein WA880_16380 [Ornithinimicrobium sp.]
MNGISVLGLSLVVLFVGLTLVLLAFVVVAVIRLMRKPSDPQDNPSSTTTDQPGPT